MSKNSKHVTFQFSLLIGVRPLLEVIVMDIFIGCSIFQVLYSLKISQANHGAA